jgi:hypothetical protein
MYVYYQFLQQPKTSFLTIYVTISHIHTFSHHNKWLLENVSAPCSKYCGEIETASEI